VVSPSQTATPSTTGASPTLVSSMGRFTDPEVIPGSEVVTVAVIFRGVTARVVTLSSWPTVTVETPGPTPEDRQSRRRRPAASVVVGSAAHATGPVQNDPPVEVEQHLDSATWASGCRECGSRVEYAPRTTHTWCVSCGAEDSIEAGTDTKIEEHGFGEWLAASDDVRAASLGGQVSTCKGCGAELVASDLAKACQFCGGHLAVFEHPDGVIALQAVVPFGVDRAGARTEEQGDASEIGVRASQPHHPLPLVSCRRLHSCYSRSSR